MKLYCCAFALLLATDINSCNDNGESKRRMLETSRKTEAVCLERGGVPIFQTNFDHMDQSTFETVSNCSFPPASPLPEYGPVRSAPVGGR